METYRKFLKSDRWEEWRRLETDQRKGVPPPRPQEPYPEDTILVDLVAPEDLTVGRMPLVEAIRRRRSRRQYTQEPLTLEELSFIAAAKATSILRTVPSAGARHPFETYTLVNRVSGLEPGLYRYLPMEHRLVFLYAGTELIEKVADAFMRWVQKSAVVFVWTAVPYRTEWRYTIVSHKMIAQESGHVCQNLYLASEAIGAGACAVGAYDQEKVDAILGVDGKDEFAIYVAPVGKVTSAAYHFEH